MVKDMNGTDGREAGRATKKCERDLAKYYGALKDNPLLDKLEADAKLVRKNANPRSDRHEYRNRE
ncbi:MAG: hypothetical protein EHM14_09865 [Methanothrix sp.]|nr:MAG: hypothetical protein EHM14_09865 [Methanothrix sp.]